MQNQPTQPTQPTQPDRASLFEGGAEGGGSLHRFFAYCRCLRGKRTPSVAARQPLAEAAPPLSLRDISSNGGISFRKGGFLVHSYDLGFTPKKAPSQRELSRSD